MIWAWDVDSTDPTFAARYHRAAMAEGVPELLRTHVELASGENGADYLAKLGLEHEQDASLAQATAARAAVLDAAAAIGAATDSYDDRGVPDADLSTEAQLKVAKVKVHLDAVAPDAATRLLELGGASAASRQRNLDRHWRNVRTITLHNPVAYKARVIGENLLHGAPIPANAYF